MRIAALVVAALAIATWPRVPTRRSLASCEGRSTTSGFWKIAATSLRSFTVNFSDLKRPGAVRGDVSGRFAYACPLEVMCEGEPAITGFFISPDSWQTGARDEAAIFQALSGVPLGSNAKKRT